MGNEASIILYRIKLRLNPNENKNKKEDDEFIAALEKIKNPASLRSTAVVGHWATAAEEIMIRGRKLLKREWQTTKLFYR
jgi:hypothetical protein